MVFLGAFAKLRKETISFVMSVCPSVRPSVRMEQLGSHGTDFHQIWYLNIFLYSVERSQVPLKSDKNKEHLTWRSIYSFDHISFNSSYSEKCFRQKLCKNSNHTFYVQLLFFENHAVYEIMWKGFVERDRPQITIWCMHIACWIPKAANTYTGYVTIIAFPLQQWLHERAPALRYTHIACLVNS
jgi:hypothetical protein